MSYEPHPDVPWLPIRVTTAPRREPRRAFSADDYNKAIAVRRYEERHFSFNTDRVMNDLARLDYRLKEVETETEGLNADLTSLTDDFNRLDHHEDE